MSPRSSLKSDLQHRIWLIEHNGLHSTPLSLARTRSVLDLACGTGAWTVAFARKHPRIQVVGVDLIHPEISEFDPPPLNCTFVVEDVEKPWDFCAERNTFDFVHARMLANVIRDWESFFATCYAHLSAGGWLEVDDVVPKVLTSDPELSADNSPVLRWWSRVFEASAKLRGADLTAAEHHSERLKQAGFEVVKDRRLQWYCGVGEADGDKERAIGELMIEDMCTLIRVATLNLIRSGGLKALDGLSEREARTMADTAELELRRSGAKFYLDFVVIVAKKGE